MKIKLRTKKGHPVYEVTGFIPKDLFKLLKWLDKPPVEDFSLSFSGVLYHFKNSHESHQFASGLQAGFYTLYKN